jgi:hypothetical protein
MAPIAKTPFTPGWFHFAPTKNVAFVFNEGGRGLTLSVYRNPFGLRVYLAGHVWQWDCTRPRQTP